MCGRAGVLVTFDNQQKKYLPILLDVWVFDADDDDDDLAPE